MTKTASQGYEEGWHSNLSESSAMYYSASYLWKERNSTERSSTERSSTHPRSVLQNNRQIVPSRPLIFHAYQIYAQDPSIVLHTSIDPQLFFFFLGVVMPVPIIMRNPCKTYAVPNILTLSQSGKWRRVKDVSY